MGGGGGADRENGNEKRKSEKSPHHFPFITFLPSCPPDHRQYSVNQIYDLSHLNSVDFLKRHHGGGGGGGEGGAGGGGQRSNF